MGKRQYRCFETEQVDENGEFRGSHREASYIIDDGPNYIRLYLDEVLSTLYDLPASCSTVLFGLLKKVSYANGNDLEESMTVYINSSLKKDILEKSDLISSTKTITNALHLLTQRGVIRHISRGKYQINPYLFGKGKWTDINELRMTHVWNCFGHTVEINVQRKKKVPFCLSDEDKKIYDKYNALEEVAKDKGTTLEEFLKQLGVPNPPDWWYRLS